MALSTREWRVISTKVIMALGFEGLNIDTLYHAVGVALQESF